MERKRVTVIGVSSRQGRSVAEALLKSNKYQVRGTARNVDKVKDLQQRGVEIFAGDANNPSDMARAIEGSYAVFAVTFFWDPSQMHRELEVGKMLADIAKEKGVKSFIYSSLGNAELVSGNKYKVPHFTDKSRVMDYVKGKRFEFSSFPAPAFFYENFHTFCPPHHDADGTTVFCLPDFPGDVPIHMYDINDIGEAVLHIIENPEKWNGKFIPLYGEKITMNEIARQYAEVTKKKARYEVAPRGKYGEEFQEMLDYFKDFGYFGTADTSIGKELIEKSLLWVEWIRAGNLE